MALSTSNAKKLVTDLKSYTNIYSLCKEIIAANNMTPMKYLKSVFFYIFTLIISFLLIKHVSFNILFENIVNLNLTISVGLIGLLIGGFSIVMSSATGDSLYCLILYKEKNKNMSFYKETLLKCMEPLIWFLLLLFISFTLRIMYLFYSNSNLNIQFSYLIKGVVISILLHLVLTSLKSLEIFLLNMYNMITAYSRFEVLNRLAKSRNKSMEEVIVDLENNLDGNE